MRVIFTIILVSFFFSANAQMRKSNRTLKVRHIQGVKSFELGGGVSGYGLFGDVYFTQFFQNNIYWKIGGGYEFKRGKGDTDYSSIFGDVLIGYTVLDKGSVFVNVLGGGTAAFDELKGIDTEKNVSGMVYGPVVGAEIEWYVANNVVFVISGTERIIISKEFGNRWYLGAGLRFKL